MRDGALMASDDADGVGDGFRVRRCGWAHATTRAGNGTATYHLFEDLFEDGIWRAHCNSW